MDLEQQLREQLAARDPGPVFTDGVMTRLGDCVGSAREVASGHPAGSARRSRWILMGTFAAVAAAAAMLIVQLGGNGAGTGAAAGDTAVVLPTRVAPAEGVPHVHVDADAQISEAERQKEGPAAGNTSAAAAQPPGFTVSVGPMVHVRDEPGSRQATEEFRNALLLALREVPGIALVPWVEERAAARASPDFVITLVNQQSQPQQQGGSLTVIGGTHDVRASFPPETWLVSAHVAASAGRSSDFRTTVAGLIPGASLPPICSVVSTWVGSGPCRGPAEAAQELVFEIRLQSFPFDAAIQQEIRRRLRDPSLSAAQKVLLLSRISIGGMRGRAVTLEPADVRSIAEMAQTLDAAARRPLWQALRGIRHPALAGLLVESLQKDADDELRLQALDTLVAGYADDPGVRAALGAVAETDPSQLVRMAARRFVEGEAAWREYVVSTLKDAKLPVVRRLEPIIHARASTQNAAGAEAFQALLTADVQDALVAIVRETLAASRSQAARDPVEFQSFVAASRALEILGSNRHPAAKALRIEIVRNADGAAAVMFGTTALLALASDPDDAEVRQVLEDAAAGRLDPGLRAMAQQLLESAQPRPPAVP